MPKPNIGDDPSGAGGTFDDRLAAAVDMPTDEEALVRRLRASGSERRHARRAAPLRWLAERPLSAGSCACALAVAAGYAGIGLVLPGSEGALLALALGMPEAAILPGPAAIGGS
jgi:hypothetical protein